MILICLFAHRTWYIVENYPGYASGGVCTVSCFLTLYMYNSIISKT